MKTINHEYYVSPELAELLEKAEFDWRCKYAYIITPDGDMPTGEEGMLTEYVENVNWLVKAPTLEVAQRWLREVKGVYLDIDTHFNSAEVWFSYVINVLDFDAKFGTYSNCLGAGHSFNEHKEALEAGIKKALEIILEKGE